MKLSCKGPYGDFVVGRATLRKVILIAGGTGITPFCAFMEAALRQNKLDLDCVHIYYGSRSPELLIYRTLIDDCIRRFSSFKATYYSESGEKGSFYRIGKLDISDIINQTNDSAAFCYYLSGPKLMIDTFQLTMDNEYQIPPSQILIDAWA